MIKLPSPREIDRVRNTRVYRSRLVGLWLPLLGGFTLFFIYFTFFGASARYYGPRLALMSASLLYVGVRAGLIVGPNGILIRNQMWAKGGSFGWDDIDHFEVREFRGWPYVAYVVTHSAGPVPIIVIGSPPGSRATSDDLRRVEREVAELNALIQHYVSSVGE